MKYLHKPLFQLVALFLCFTLLSGLTISINAQTFCPAGSSAPASNPRSTAWAQNALVSVNVNSIAFTRDEFDNCIKPIFDNFNLVNSATQAGNGNFSGVQYSVTYGPNAVASIDPLTGAAVNAPGVTNGLEVTRTNLPNTTRGETIGATNGTSRYSSVIQQNANMTSCGATQENLAHELGHTQGLGECSPNNCDASSSVMRRYECVNQPLIRCLNFSGQALTSPSQCDNEKIQQAGQYTRPPTPTPTPTPTPSEICDGIDNDGDGIIDEGFDTDWDGWTTCAGDCDDENPNIYPGNCNPMSCIDHNCNGRPDCEDRNCTGTPIVIDVAGNGFNLTDFANGVQFDLTKDGVREQLSWTSTNSDDAWLVLDRNNNGTIDNGSELFGNFTPQPLPTAGEERNGFLALALHDKSPNGGNVDGVINNQDSVFTTLRLWQDINHNGVSEQNELHTLTELGLAELDLNYKESKRTDEHGNIFRYRAKVKDARGEQVGRWAWDVYLVYQSRTSSANPFASAKLNLMSPSLGFVETLVNKNNSRCGG